MINKTCLNFQVNSFKWESGRKINLVPTIITDELIDYLFKEYKDFEISGTNYCCHGKEECCEEKYIEDREEAEEILHYIKQNQYKDLRNDENRVYINKEDVCTIYFYGRDIEDGIDYVIFFY